MQHYVVSQHIATGKKDIAAGPFPTSEKAHAALNVIKSDTLAHAGGMGGFKLFVAHTRA